METSLVSRNPEIMSGALCFTGTRVLVKNLFDYLEGASSLEDFPSVSREKAVAVLEAARERLSADALAAFVAIARASTSTAKTSNLFTGDPCGMTACSSRTQSGERSLCDVCCVPGSANVSQETTLAAPRP